MIIDLLMVRHGESVRNLSCDFARIGDTEELERQLREDHDEGAWELTPRGLEQAQATGLWIRNNFGIEFDRAYTSPFVRARQTAEGLGLGLDWIEDTRIQEREWGDYCAEGLAPYTAEAYLQHLGSCSLFTWRAPFPGAESLEDLVPRCASFIHEVVSELGQGRVIVVSHGGTLRAMQMVLHGLPKGQHGRLPRARMTNGTVLAYRLELSPDRRTWHGQFAQFHPAVIGAADVPWRDL